jgi:uncharacterized membrane protein
MEDRKTNTVSLAEVDTLGREGLIASDQYLDAVYYCRDDDRWTRWALWALLALGTGHLLSGIVFFFAYNWDSLSPMTKFGILQSGIIICAVAALIVKLDRPAGQVLLIAATVLVGTLHAVIGQVYQTGADFYGLFMIWALLVIPWVFASRSAVHWFVWLVLVFLTIGRYGNQVLIPIDTLSRVELNCVMSAAAALVLLLREWAVLSGKTWLAPQWTRALPAFALLAFIFISTIGYIVTWHSEIIAPLAFAIMAVVLAAIYRSMLPDLRVIAICVGFATLILMAVGGRVLHEVIGFDFDNSGQMIFVVALLVLWCAGLTTGSLKLLIALRRELENGDSNE